MYTYEVFGNLTEQTGETENSFLYCGEQYDSNTGFYYLRARYMDPSVGRFVYSALLPAAKASLRSGGLLSAALMDPYSGSLFDPMSLHKYLYANANPVTYSDPTGYFSLADISVSQTISDILDSINSLHWIKIFDIINSAATAYDFVRTIYDAVLNGDNIEEMAMSLAMGMITSAAINKCTLLKTPIIKNFMTGIFTAFGVAGEAKGIYDAIDEGDYDLAVTRSVQLAMTVVSTLFFNCFTGETMSRKDRFSGEAAFCRRQKALNLQQQKTDKNELMNPSWRFDLIIVKCI